MISLFNKTVTFSNKAFAEQQPLRDLEQNLLIKSNIIKRVSDNTRFKIIDDDTYLRNIDTDNFEAATIVQDLETKKNILIENSEINKSFVKVPHKKVTFLDRIYKSFLPVIGEPKQEFPKRTNRWIVKSIRKDRLEKGVPSSAFGEQIKMFDTPLTEGQTKKGKNGDDLVFKKHRWRYLSDEIGKDGLIKMPQPKDENVYDPDQIDMFEPQEPPLAQVADALDKVEQIQNEEKLKKWEKLSEHYLREANYQKEGYLSDMDEVARENGLEEPSPKFGAFAVKDKASIMQKFERNEVKGKASANEKLTDILRTTIVVDSPKQWDKIKESLTKRGYEIYNNDIDNLYENEGRGYKHIAIKLVKGENDPIVKELLLMRPNMLKAKRNLGHDIYDLDKNILTALPHLEKESAESYGNKARDIIKEISQDYYARAYDLDLESENQSSEDTLDFTNSMPSTIKPKSNRRKQPDSRSGHNSRTIDRKFLSLLKSRFGKEVWQPIRAKLNASVSDTPSSTGSDNNERIASLISESILKPFDNVYEKYYGKKPFIHHSLSSNLSKSIRLYKEKLYYNRAKI